MSEGWAYPLKGFMHEDDYLQSLHFNTIRRDGKIYNQSVPIVLSCSSKDYELLANKKKLFLTYNEKPVAILDNISIYAHRKEERCARQFGLNNTDHPYQKYIYEECGDWLIGGDLEVLERIKWNDGLDQYRFTPAELKEKLKQMKVEIIC